MKNFFAIAVCLYLRSSSSSSLSFDQPNKKTEQRISLSGKGIHTMNDFAEEKMSGFLELDVDHDGTNEIDSVYQLANEFQVVHPENIKAHHHFSDVGQLRESGDTLLDVSGYTISASPLRINNGDIVTVSFSSLEPSSSDWIAAYSPADVDVRTVVPVKYGWCDDSPDYLSSGNGALAFNLTNLRQDVVFYFYHNHTKHPIAMAKSSNVSFINPNEPLRPRVVATGDPNVLKLLWASFNSVSPTMRWSTASMGKTDGSDPMNTVAAITEKIDRTDICGAPASSYGWFDLGLIHTAEFVGMAALAGRTIYYTFGDLNTNDFSREHTLRLPPLPGKQPADRPTRVILYDDMGRGSSDGTFTWNEYGRPAMYTAMAVGAEVADGKVDAVYHGGDISYATGYLAVWDFYLDQLSPVASGAIYLTTVGNHESDWPNTASFYDGKDSGGECGVLATRLLPMPAPAVTDKPWWSYEVGLIHFIGLSTEHNYTTGSEQWKWLEADLVNVDRTVTPWIIFGGHRAMYLNSNYGGSETSDIVVMDLMIEHLEPLLYKYKVDFGFYGHNHVVQRQSAVYQKKVVQRSTPVQSQGNTVNAFNNPGATVHMVFGTAGADFTENAVDPPPEWNEKTFYEHGYARVIASSAGQLDIEWVEAKSGVVMDRVRITKDSLDSKSTSSDSGSSQAAIEIAITVPIVVVTVASVAYFVWAFYFGASSKASAGAIIVPAGKAFNALSDTESPLTRLSLDNSMMRTGGGSKLNNAV